MERTLFAPRTSGRRTDDGVTLSIELPGVMPEDVQLALEGRTLSVRAEPRACPVPEGMRTLTSEFEDVVYQRDFELTPDLDTEAVQAKLEHGLLSLEIPIVRSVRREISLG